MEDSSFGRLIGVLVSPSKTFQSIVERPTWMLVLVVLVILGAVAGQLILQRMDMEEVIRESLAQTGQELSDDEIDVRVEVAEKFGQYGAIGGALLVAPIAYLLIALIFWVVFKLLGGEFPYKTSLAITIHGLMPWAVATLLSIPVILSRDAISYAESQSGVLTSNLAVLAAEDASLAFKTGLAAIDIFSIWTVVLYTLGFAIAARVGKISAGVTVVLLWAVYVLAKIGWVTLFS